MYEDTGGNPTAGGRLPGIIDQVTALVRAKVASCSRNLSKMGPAGMIPSECLWAACTIARSSLAASLPVSEGETDPRASELREAHKMLSDVAECKLMIEDASGNIPESVNPGGSYGGAAKLDF